MIDVKQAVINAAAFLKELVPEVSSVRVEEVDVSEDDKHWLITLGFHEPNADQPLPSLMPRKRGFKILKVDRENGQVVSMKIREPVHVG